MKVEAFIIHLARAHGRAPQVERLREALLPMPVTVIDAIDAERLSEDEIARVYRPGLHRPRYPFPLRRAEIACFLSHRTAWQTIIDRNLDAGLVVEDDVELLPNFRDVLELALANARPGDYVRFPKQARESDSQVVAEAGASRLFLPKVLGLGMQAQLVGREAASELLAFTRKFDRPVDTTIQMRWLHGVRVLSSAPVAIREVAAKLGGTTVQGKGKPFGEILSREVSRAGYRFAVAMRDVLNSRTAKDRGN
ncbi:glycosyltransferase family 25 protein [Chelativorans sp.]|uniref:glycosyltransferase family 25 protein n=1 Tax=Chelativorans sp. TaxID=2203393 RepID=UPI00281121D5|nr:glycosyltransferase family 25 protein [Chelativorans sp.]